MLAVVQARMSSRRLPGKALADLCGAPVLNHVLGRVTQVRSIDGTILATSVDGSDDPVAEAGAAAGALVVRGPLDDVLERFRLAATQHRCDAIVRITADCPLIDPLVIDAVVQRWRAGREDYVANIIEPRTFPKGMDTEVVSVSALLVAAAEAVDAVDREHVTVFVRSRPERFPQARVTIDPAYAAVRLTLDTPADLRDLRELIARAGSDASMEELIDALGARPDAQG